jgi:tetratricopeptide (TPR) repeat protein
VLPSIEGRLTNDQRFALYMMLAKVAAQCGQQPTAQQALMRLERSWSEWNDEQRSELRYQQLQLARASRNQAEVVKLAGWFLEQGRASRFEAAALSVAANALDPAATDDQKRLLYAIYGRLVELWGKDPARWTTDRNAHAAAAKRAALAWELGFEDEASRWYDALLEVYPRERAYLRAAGLLAFQKKEWQRSLQCWRTLLAGTPVGSDAWYEAKYYQLRCLLETDRTAARKVWQEFTIVAPTGGTAAWQEKFRQLQQQLAAP